MAAEDLLPPANDTDVASTPGKDDDNLPATNDGETPQQKDDEDDGDVRSTRQMLKMNPPPQPLPPGWFLKPSHSSPGNYYHFNQDTGECRWEIPSAGSDGQNNVAVSQESLNATAAAAAAAVKSILKRSNSATGESVKETQVASSPPSRKRAKTSEKDHRKEKDRSSSSGKEKHRDRDRDRHHSRSSGESKTKEVRVLHILKKHRGSRKPASWRNPKITDSKEKAIGDLRELISILNESGGDHKELRATFEELAKTESDCSSAKRGGDLGFFGRKKMQPAFEKASFGLRVGQLSDIVDTSSGVHVILRLA